MSIARNIAHKAERQWQCQEDGRPRHRQQGSWGPKAGPMMPPGTDRPGPDPAEIRYVTGQAVTDADGFWAQSLGEKLARLALGRDPVLPRCRKGALMFSMDLGSGSERTRALRISGSGRRC